MHSFVVNDGSFDVVCVQGLDAVRFLQGQLTCDVSALAANSQTYGACCNNKGRVIAGLILVIVDEIFYLCTPRGMGPVLIEALRKYLPFYKCELTLGAGDHQLIALAGASIDQIEQFTGMQPGNALSFDSGWLCKLDGQGARALWWCDKAQSEHLTISNAPTLGALEQWECLGLLDGHYPLQCSDSLLYTPQELNYNQNGYVSFAKGCYTGQEIVARMHYRGKPKKQLFLAKLAKPIAAIGSGQYLHVTDAQSRELGICRLSRSCGTLHLALIELPADFTGNFETLAIADTAVLTGCAFESNLLRYSGIT